MNPEAWRKQFVHDLAYSPDPLFVVLRVINRYNPIGILWSENPDEYAVEAEHIVGRTVEARGPEDTTWILYDVFVQAFDQKTAGTEGEYASLGHDPWEAWIKLRADQGRSAGDAGS